MSLLLTGYFHQIINLAKYCSFPNILQRQPFVLYKYLMRQCDKLPKGAKQHYKFQIRQVRTRNAYCNFKLIKI